MYKEHPSFECPGDENAKIWRYLELRKFNFLIKERKLYFARADKFKDLFEGTPSKIYDQIRNNIYEILKNGSRKKRKDTVSPPFKKLKACTYLSCWHLREDESKTMWDEYLSNDEGVAIQTTYQKLKENMDN